MLTDNVQLFLIFSQYFRLSARLVRFTARTLEPQSRDNDRMGCVRFLGNHYTTSDDFNQALMNPRLA